MGSPIDTAPTFRGCFEPEWRRYRISHISERRAKIQFVARDKLHLLPILRRNRGRVPAGSSRRIAGSRDRAVIYDRPILAHSFGHVLSIYWRLSDRMGWFYLVERLIRCIIHTLISLLSFHAPHFFSITVSPLISGILSDCN